MDNPEKEILNQLFSDIDNNAKFPVVEEKEPAIEKSVESYIEKLEKEIYLTTPITDDAGQPVASPPAPQDPVIALPVSATTYTKGLVLPVTESLRWLVEWCRRLIKIFGDRASFKEVES